MKSGDEAILARLGLDDGDGEVSPEQAHVANLAAPKAKARASNSNSGSTEKAKWAEEVMLFDPEGKDESECAQHFWEASKFFPGHNSVRRLDNIESLMSVLPEDCKSINSLLDFDDWEDLVSHVKDLELPRRESRTLRELWGLANQVYGYITSNDDALESSPHKSRGKKRKKSSDDSSSSKSKRKKARKKEVKSMARAFARETKKKSGAASDEESSASSDIRKRVPSLLKKAKLKKIQPDSFVVQDVLKKALKDLKSQNITKQSLDVFVSQYVGEGKPEPKRKELVKARAAEIGSRPLAFLESTLVFWVTHMADSKVAPESILAHFLDLFKIIYKNGVPLACRYERLLIAKLQDKARYEDVVLDDSLAVRDKEIYTELTGDKSLEVGNRDKSAHEDAPSPPSRPSHPKGGGKKGGKGKSPKGKADWFPPEPPWPKDKSSGSKQKVCLFEDPRNNRFCRYGKDCRDLHLDTRVSKELRRFQGAQKAAESFRGR